MTARVSSPALTPFLASWTEFKRDHGHCMKKSHAVTVLGREFSVRSSAPEEKVKAVEACVNRKLQEIGSALKSGDAQLVLTLALLNTSEELLELRSHRENDASVDARINTMIGELEKV